MRITKMKDDAMTAPTREQADRIAALEQALEAERKRADDLEKERNEALAAKAEIKRERDELLEREETRKEYCHGGCPNRVLAAEARRRLTAAESANALGSAQVTALQEELTALERTRAEDMAAVSLARTLIDKHNELLARTKAAESARDAMEAQAAAMRKLIIDHIQRDGDSIDEHAECSFDECSIPYLLRALAPDAGTRLLADLAAALAEAERLRKAWPVVCTKCGYHVAPAQPPPPEQPAREPSANCYVGHPCDDPGCPNYRILLSRCWPAAERTK
jgi:hypothetical protein